MQTDGVEQAGLDRFQVITLEPGKVEMEYRADEDSGVYILSEVEGDSRFLLITTLQGELLYRATSPHNKDILVSLMGQEFLIVSHNRLGKASSASQGFMVPTANVRAVEEVLLAGLKVPIFANSYEDGDSVFAMRQSYRSLLDRDEVTFFIEASKILGRDMGILGGDYPAAMSVYVMAMRLAKNSDKYSRLDVASEPRKSVYYEQSCNAPNTFCSNNKACCPKCPIGNGCLGLCGPGCTCWSWACGDCCYHQGCYDHDLCCEKTYLNWDCLGVWKFQCNSYSCAA